MAEASADLRLEPGDEASSFELTGTDGGHHRLDDFSGYEATLIVFTCNHCPYAQNKHPLLNRIADDYDEVAVIGINPNNNPDYPEDSFENMVDRVDEGEIRYDAYLFDETQAVAKAYGAVCTPDPFLFENDGGTFILRYHGRLDDAPNPDEEPTRIEIQDAIDTVLADEEIGIEQRPSRGCSIKWQDGNEPAYWDRV